MSQLTRYGANQDFEPIVLIGAEEAELQVIAELIDVLSS